MRPVRIFLSSPGDVRAERDAARRVCERLSSWFAGRARIEPMVWEHEPLDAAASFQEQLPLPSACDLVVVILWSRMGTRLPESVVRPDGRPYESGTAFEIEDALRGRPDGTRPRLFVYRKTSDPMVSLRTDPAALAKLREQQQTLDAFLQRMFGTGPDGAFARASSSFDTTATFEGRLWEHLRKAVDDLLEAPRPAGASAPAKRYWEGCPFRGLEPFEAQHADVFFGRADAVNGVIEGLRAQAGRGHAFVLVVGMSGCGKSSLCRAGVAPRVTTRGVVEGVSTWYRAVLTPGSQANPVRALAAALAPIGLTGSQEVADKDLDRLERVLRGPPDALVLLLRSAMAGPGGARPSEEGEPRLFLVVDQLEELFSDVPAVAADRGAFLAALDTLVRSGRVWTVATLRSDFYPHVTDSPELRALKEGSGQYDLTAPTPAEVGQMIREPARAAGLTFGFDHERHIGLDEVLRDEAVRDPSSLPLLQFTLEKLYDARDQAKGELTVEAYRPMKGLAGALASHAQDVFQRLAPETRALLPRLLRALVDIHPVTGLVVRRRVERKQLEADPLLAPLVQQFVKARLLTAEVESGDRGVVYVAHESLLERWPEAKRVVDEDREVLRIRPHLALLAQAWDAAKRPTGRLLQPGPELADGERLHASGLTLDGALPAFLEDSLARGRRLRTRRRVAVALVCALALVAGVLAVLFRGERDVVAHKMAEVYRLSAADDARRLIRESDALWPVHPRIAPQLKQWLVEAGELVRQLPEHRAALERLRSSAAGSDEAGEHDRAWQERSLSDMIQELERFEGPPEPLLARIEARLEAVKTLEARSLREPAAAWQAAIEEVRRNPRYGGLVLEPQLGLVPLGADPVSGLQEFAHLGSGTVPTRTGPGGTLAYADDSAIVLVLLPGTEFWMGAQSADPKGRNYDKLAGDDEAPVRLRRLPARFFAKHEVTQAQWRHLTEGKNPSFFQPGTQAGGHTITWRNPVESVTWHQVNDVLDHHLLRLPTEEEWEAAARAGAEVYTPWSTGAEEQTLQGHANVADIYCKAHGGEPGWGYVAIDDGHFAHAPVGTYLANALGLHDLHGNVLEWCEDAYAGYAEGSEPERVKAGGETKRVYRGGSWSYAAREARSALRDADSPLREGRNHGVRAARSVDEPRNR